MMLLVLVMGISVLWPVSVMAWEDPICSQLDPIADADAYIAAGCGGGGGQTVFDKVPGAVMAVFSIAGIIAAGVIIFGGVRYSISQGDPGKVKKAKDTIMYAIIGLIVTLLAFAITAFVLGGIQ